MPPEQTVRLPGFLVRQPVLDGACRAAGYEFGVRDRAVIEVLPGATDPGQARDEYLISSIVDLDFRQALGRQHVWLDVAPATWDNPMLSLLPAGKTGIFLPVVQAGLAGRMESLAGCGLAPVLDDTGTALPAAPIGRPGSVRLDCARFDAAALGARTGYWRAAGASQMIAGNVDSEEMLDVCRKLGFDLFQGEFLTRPRLLATRKVEAGILNVMELLNLVREQAPAARLETVFKRDPVLTYKLLRFINAPANGLARPVQSIAQAILWLGHAPLYRWLTLLLFGAGTEDARARALLGNALVRARFMENIGAGQLPPDLRGGLFIVGILSHLDALLDLPMARALEPLGLAEPMRAALLGGDGPYAPWLKLARACERFDQHAVAALAGDHAMSDDAINLAHVEALIWAESVVAE